MLPTDRLQPCEHYQQKKELTERHSTNLSRSIKTLISPPPAASNALRTLQASSTLSDKLGSLE